jgi:hypothetical protein
MSAGDNPLLAFLATIELTAVLDRPDQYLTLPNIRLPFDIDRLADVHRLLQSTPAEQAGPLMRERLALEEAFARLTNPLPSVALLTDVEVLRYVWTMVQMIFHTKQLPTASDAVALEVAAEFQRYESLFNEAQVTQVTGAGTDTYYQTDALPAFPQVQGDLWQTVRLEAADLARFPQQSSQRVQQWLRESPVFEWPFDATVQFKAMQGKILRLKVVRSWLDPALFDSRRWTWPLEPLSTGDKRPQGQMPAYVTEVLLARDLTLELAAVTDPEVGVLPPPIRERIVQHVLTGDGEPLPETWSTYFPVPIRIESGGTLDLQFLQASELQLWRTRQVLRTPQSRAEVAAPDLQGLEASLEALQQTVAAERQALSTEHGVYVLGFVCQRLLRVPNPDPALFPGLVIRSPEAHASSPESREQTAGGGNVPPPLPLVVRERNRTQFAGFGEPANTGGWGVRGAIAFSPVDDQLVAGHEWLTYSMMGELVIPTGENRILLWDVRQQNGLPSQLWGKPRSGSAARILVFSADGRWLASGHASSSFGPPFVTLWDVASRREVATFETRGTVNRVLFSPSGDRVIALDETEFIYVWETGSRAVRDVIPLPASPDIIDIALTSEGKTFALGYRNGIIRLITARRTYDTERVPLRELRALQFSPDHRMLAGIGVNPDNATRTSKLCIWDVATGKNLHTLLIESDEGAMNFAPDGRVLATGGWRLPTAPSDGDGGVIHLWDVVRGELITQMQSPPEICINYLGFSSNGRLLASGGMKAWNSVGDLVIWSISD